MRRHALVPVALALLVVLAGCSVFGSGGRTRTAASTPVDTATDTGGGTTDEESTAADETATTDEVTPTATPDPTPSGALPAGVRRSGTVNETKLARRTFAAMNRSTVRVVHRNGPNRTVLVRDGRTAYHRNDRGVTWSRGNASVTNATLFGPELESSYDESALGMEPGGGVVFALGIRLGTAEYEWRGTRTVDGTRLHVLEMTRATGAGALLGVYDGTMLVDERGRIHRLAGVVGENDSVAERYRFAFDWDASSVPRPPWLDDVPRLSADRVADGRLLAVAVTGGAPVPAGTTLRFSYNGTRRETTLSAPLEPGERLYLGLDADDGSLVVARERPDPAGLASVDDGIVGVRGTAELPDGRTVRLQVAVGRLSA